MVDIPNTQPFSPSGVQTFGIFDPNGLNTNFSNIQAAFATSRSTITGDTQLTATLRNVSADLSTAGGPILVTLPANPTVGDPPCSVAVLTTYYSALGSPFANCIITTSDGMPISSIVPNVGNTNAASIGAAGDFLAFRYVGGALGWLATGQLCAAMLNTPPARGACPWQGQRLSVNTSGGPMALGVEGLQAVGANATIVRTAGASNISVGDSTSKFNGVSGPYVISASNIAYKFTCLGSRAFEVTT